MARLFRRVPCRSGYFEVRTKSKLDSNCFGTSPFLSLLCTVGATVRANFSLGLPATPLSLLLLIRCPHKQGKHDEKCIRRFVVASLYRHSGMSVSYVCQDLSARRQGSWYSGFYFG